MRGFDAPVTRTWTLPATSCPKSSISRGEPARPPVLVSRTARPSARRAADASPVIVPSRASLSSTEAGASERELGERTYGRQSPLRGV